MPTYPITGDQRFVKNINRAAVLRLLRDVTGLSRADLAERSGLQRSTVSQIIKELLDEGWLIEEEVLATGALGRRPTPLRLDGHRLRLIGAELAPDAIRVVSTSILGDLIEVNQAPLTSRQPEAACHQLVEMITALAARVAESDQRLLGIGVGLPGSVDVSTGILQFAPNIGWRKVEVGRRLLEELTQAGLTQVPVFCQNEADLAAIGETEFGDRPVDDPLVYISCGVGVGSGIILNDALFTGATGSAGEIGHTTLVIDGAPCSCGRLGCAEAYVGLKAIAAATQCAGPSGIDREALKAVVTNGNQTGLDAFARAGASLGVLLQNTWTTFNPQVIVLGGETVALGGTTFIDAAAQVLRHYAECASLPEPKIRMARYGEFATAVGGAGYVLHGLLHPYFRAQLTSPFAQEPMVGP